MAETSGPVDIRVGNKIKKAAALSGWLICLFGAIFYCYEYLLRMEPSVMVPELMASFQVTAVSLGVLSAVYYFIYTPMQLVVGVIVDLYGPRRILTMATVACTIGVLIFGGTSSLYVAAFGRFLIGFGSAFAFVGVLKLAAVWLPLKRFAFFAGFATALGMVGAMVGAVGLTALIDHVGWRYTLILSSIIGFCLIPVLWFGIRDGEDAEHSTPNAEKSFKSLGKNILNVIINPQMWLIGVVGFILYLSLSAFAELWGIPFLSHSFQYSKQVSANLISGVFLGWLVGAPFMGWFSDRIKSRKMTLLIGVLVSLIVIAIILLLPSTISAKSIYLLLFLFGFFSSAEIVCFAMGRDIAGSRLAGTSVSFVNMIIMLGGVIFQPLIGKFLDWHSHTMIAGAAVYDGSDYRVAMITLPVSLVIGLFLLFYIRETHDATK